MKIHFYGAAREVTGSCYLVELHEHKILVDCGMFQGSRYASEKNFEPFQFDPTRVDSVLVTHAHIDHNGRIPKLVHEGFRGKIYASEPTAALLEIMWNDAVRIMRYAFEKNKDPMLYSEEDVKRAVEMIHPVPYHEPVRLPGDGVAKFFDAGHIIGSAWIEIKQAGKTVVFSGDVGNDDVPIIRETEPIAQADAVICESTYGDRLHESAIARSSRLKTVIEDSVKRGGVLMIPAFSLERTQEILYELNWLIEECKCLPRVPIYLDSPLAIRATEVFKEFTDYYDQDALALKKLDGDLFDFPGLEVTLDSSASRKINSAKNPKVIIAGGGMMVGGRILHHLIRYLGDKNSTLLIVSYQADGTLGRKIQDGAKVVSIFGKRIEVKCRVERLGSYSAHGDQAKVLRWLGTADPKPKHVYLSHGDPSAQDEFVQCIERDLGVAASAPEFGGIVEV